MNGTFGVVSTFSPDSRVVAGIKKISRQFDKLLIIDDGSPDPSILDSILLPNVEVHKYPENSGIGHALNLGISLALQENAEFIVTLDQDTIPEDDYVEKCQETFKIASKSTRIGIVLADKINNIPSIPPRYSPESLGLVDVGIQSGMMISSRCISEIGLLDEKLFIDCVDTEYCLRAKQFNWNIAVATDSNIKHSLGVLCEFRPFGFKAFGVAKYFEAHKPFRQYYITRNNIDLILRIYRFNTRLALRLIKREILPHFLAITGGPNRFKQTVAVIAGCIHGITRRRGKIPHQLGLFLK